MGKKTDKDKLEDARDFCREVVDYFDGMAVMTDDEEALRDSAESLLEELEDEKR